MRSFNLFIIGMRHHEPKDRKFQEKLLRKAIQGEIVVGIEGIPRDDAKEQGFVRAVYGLETKGLVFGFEDDFANKYSGALLHYGYFANDMKQEFLTTKAQLIYDLRESPSIQRSWQTMGQKTLPHQSHQLYDQLTRFLSDHEAVDTKTVVNRFADSIGRFGERMAWVELYRVLIDEMNEEVKRLPEELRVDLGQVASYLNEPTGVRADYVVFEINNRWRNQFIFKNMKEIADVAVAKGLDVCFLIGAGHVQDISAMFDVPYRGLIKRVYYRTELVPKDFFPCRKIAPELLLRSPKPPAHLLTM